MCHNHPLSNLTNQELSHHLLLSQAYLHTQQLHRATTKIMQSQIVTKIVTNFNRSQLATETTTKCLVSEISLYSD